MNQTKLNPLSYRTFYSYISLLCLFACNLALPCKLAAQTSLLYGVRLGGGSYGMGAIISFNPVSNAENVVWSFGSGTDAMLPDQSLVYDSINGLFYTTATQGGAYGWGAIVSFDPLNNTEKLLYSFSSSACGSQYQEPGDLAYDPANGLFYSLLPDDGNSYCAGAILSFNPANNVVNESSYIFDSQNDTDGVPVASQKLVYYSGNGSFYAMTSVGGALTDGAIISYNPSSYYEKVLWSFGRNQDGVNPHGNFVYDTTTGLFYGLTSSGGSYDMGTIISFNPANNEENVIWNFGSDSDGTRPNKDFVFDPDNGLYYATTTQGGSNNAGAIISFNPANNAENVVWSLTNEGYGYLEGNLTYDPVNKLFYAMPGLDDAGDDGTIISFNPANNTVNLLYTFDDGPDSGPGTGLVLFSAPASCAASAALTITSDTNTAMLIHTVGQAGGTPPYTYSWTWGDNSAASLGSASSHTYNAGGYYNVCLTITDSAGCTSTACDSYYVQPCFARFTLNTDTGTAYTVDALSQSLGVAPVSYAWSWGDGNQGNGPDTISHTYSTYGFYNICLTVTDSTGCTSNRCDSTYDLKSCFAHFTVQPDTGVAFSIYTFNQSAGIQPITYSWTWGDGDSSSGYMGSHTYVPGNYDICLSIADSAGCVALYCDPNVWIKTCFAHFTLYPDTTIPHHWYALTQALGVPPLYYWWSWGDSTDSYGYSPTASHTYSEPGYYNICLTINDSVSCSDTYCDSSTYIRQAGDTMITVKVVTQLPLETGISEAGAEWISIYPNPANNRLTVSGLSNGQIVMMYNCLGQLLSRAIARNVLQVLDISAQANGLYLVQILDADGKLLTEKKVVKID